MVTEIKYNTTKKRSSISVIESDAANKVKVQVNVIFAI